VNACPLALVPFVVIVIDFSWRRSTSATSSSAGNPESVTHVLGQFCYLSLRLLRAEASDKGIECLRPFHVADVASLWDDLQFRAWDSALKQLSDR
jgi:hypothetical protein